MGRGTVVAPLTSRGRPALCGPLARCPELLGATEAGRISATPSHQLDTTITITITVFSPPFLRRVRRHRRVFL